MRKNYISKKAAHTLILMFVFSSFLFYASSTGITGQTLKTTNEGCTCHGIDPTQSVMVSINGPDTLLQNQTATYTLTIQGGTLVRGGTNIASSAGTLIAGTGMQSIGGEITHTTPRLPSSGVVTFTFQYTAPSTLGNITLYANGNSVNFNGSNEGDNWNFADNKVILVTDVIPVELSAFSANVSENNVLLEWTTASEKNNQGFYIEKTNTLGDWENIGFVEGKGTTTELNNYLFKDENVKPGVYNYRLKQVDFDGSTSYHFLSNEVIIDVPSSFALLQNYPNPFNPSTEISYQITENSNIKLIVYDILGNEVAVLVNENQTAGTYKVGFSGKGLSSGVYMYQLNINDEFIETKKMVLMQ